MQGREKGNRIKKLSKKEKIEKEQKSKDNKMKREGRKTCKFLEEQGWTIIIKTAM